MSGSRFGAAVFDLFGTLVPEFPREEFYGVIDEMARILGAEPGRFREVWDVTSVQRQTGRIPTMEQSVRVICETAGARLDEGALARAMEVRADLYRRWFRPRDGALETLRALKEREYPVELISMCAPDTPAMWRSGELAAFVDVEVFSSEVGLRKPDPEIYRLACERLRVDPSACLYCGDGSYGELTGAAAAGMTVFMIADPRVDPAVQLRPEGEDWTGPSVSDLRELLPLLPPPA